MLVTPLGKIIIVDDDENISSLLSINLSSEGYDIVVYPNANDAATSDFSGVRLVLADAMDKEYTGISLLKDLKSNPLTVHIGFIICSTSDSERLIIEALDAGADDYMSKPISSRELIARINSVLRRRRMMDSRRAANQVSFKGLVLDTSSGQASIDGNPASLSKAEFLILGMLLRNRGQFFERIEIKHEAWDNISDVSDRAVDTTISRLRKKLGDYGRLLVNRQGFGYGFVE